MASETTSRWHTASAQGPRTVNADAVGAFARPGQNVTFALADGIGDDLAAAKAARIAAGAAARSPTADGPVEAVLAAQRAVLEQLGSGGSGDCVLVVAIPFEGGYHVAWVGDARAYAWDGEELSQATHDHTVAQYFRDHGQATAPRMEHMVTTSVRTAKPGEIGSAEVTSQGLLLTSDGVHKQLTEATIRDVLARPENAAAALVETAIAVGGTDNATAIFVEPPGIADPPGEKVPPATVRMAAAA